MKSSRLPKRAVPMSSSIRSADPEILSYLADRKSAVDRALDRLLPPEDTYPRELNQAMRYSVFAGGKRLRPILALAAGEALGGDPDRIMVLACALEMIHTYSLIHDDLPAMDNDNLRRGRPSCHREFGEAVAILAGNGLMNLAYQILAEEGAKLHDPRRMLEAISQLSRAVDRRQGVIAGQVVDLVTEGKSFTEKELRFIHSCKTGALIRASVVCAAIISAADPSAVKRLDRFGMKAGLAFQIVDDILDITGDSRELGKTAGKDREEQKATYPALFGLEESRRRVEVLVREAEKELEFLGEHGLRLKELARFISVRRY